MPNPLPNVHRHNRRKLGRGQYPRPTPVTAMIVGNGTTVTVTFTTAVIISGDIGLLITTRTILTQTQTTPTSVTLTTNADTANTDYTFNPSPSNIKALNGAIVIGETGTFMLPPDVILHSAGGNYYPPSAANVANGVQFGVGNTSETGTYAPAPPVTTRLSGAVDNGDGTYDVFFSADTTITLISTETSLLMYDPNLGTFAPVVLNSQISSAVIRVVGPSSTPGGKWLVMIAVPTHLSSPQPFEFSTLQTIS